MRSRKSSLDSHLSNRQNTHSPYWFCPIQFGSPDSPDLVLPELSPDTKWRRVSVDEAVVDRMCYGIECDNDILTLGIHRTLNTKAYNRLIETITGSLGPGVIRYLQYQINQIPIPCEVLSEGFVRQSAQLFPPSTRQDEIRLKELLLDCTTSEASRNSFELLFDSDDQFAWAWFLSVEEYEKFTQLWSEDEERAKSYVAERLDEHVIESIDVSLEREDIPPSRAEIIDELLDEFNENKYRLFLYGIAPQFEGVIMDWAAERGHEVRRGDDGQPYVFIPTDKGEETVRKSLTALLKYYLRDGFGEFLLNQVRDARNNITHGEVVANDRDQAAMFLLCLHALCRRTLFGE